MQDYVPERGHNHKKEKEKKGTRTTPAGWIGASTPVEINSTQTT